MANVGLRNFFRPAETPASSPQRPDATPAKPGVPGRQTPSQGPGLRARVSQGLGMSTARAGLGKLSALGQRHRHADAEASGAPNASGSASPPVPHEGTERHGLDSFSWPSSSNTSLSASSATGKPVPARPAIPRRSSSESLLGDSPRLSQLLDSSHPLLRSGRSQVFSDKLQTREAWSSFIHERLGAKPSDKLKEHPKSWSTDTFHALFMAAWAHRPTEKGAYMIDLSSLPEAQRDGIKKACKDNGTYRISSHLSKNGYSASKNFEMLKGYDELLVQHEKLNGKDYLYLKAEGHTTGISGVVGHTEAYVHKKKHGVGLERSPYLGAMAQAVPELVTQRAAENFSKPYGELLNRIGLKGKKVTVRETADRLFQLSGFTPPGASDAASHTKSADNEQLGRSLKAYCDHVEKRGGRDRHVGDGHAVLTDELLNELRTLGDNLIADGPVVQSRVYHETILQPHDLDKAARDLSAGHEDLTVDGHPEPPPAYGAEARPPAYSQTPSPVDVR